MCEHGLSGHWSTRQTTSNGSKVGTKTSEIQFTIIGTSSSRPLQIAIQIWGCKLILLWPTGTFESAIRSTIIFSGPLVHLISNGNCGAIGSSALRIKTWRTSLTPSILPSSTAIKTTSTAFSISSTANSPYISDTLTISLKIIGKIKILFLDEWIGMSGVCILIGASKSSTTVNLKYTTTQNTIKTWNSHAPTKTSESNSRSSRKYKRAQKSL